MHSTPNTGQSQKWKVAKWMGYCLLLRLKAECLLNNVKWVMNDSSMFSLIVWKNLREGESLFLLLFVLLVGYGWKWDDMRSDFFFHCRYGLLSWKLAIICMKQNTSSALTISWWLKQLFLQTKEQQIPPQIPWKHYLSFKQEYAALKCMPNEQNKLTSKQKKAQKPFISVKNSMWAIAIHLATFHFWLWPVFGSTVHSSIT